MKTPRIRLLGAIRPDSTEWTCVVELEPRKRDVSLDGTREAIRLFTEGGNAGMFSGQGFPPWQSEIELVPSEGAASAALRFEMRLRHVDRGAVRVLANLLASKTGGEDLDINITLLDGGTIPRRAQPVKPEDLPFPAMFTPTPFGLELTPPEKSLVPITARMEFLDELEDSEAEALWARTRVWEEIVEARGYPEPDGDAERQEWPGLSETETYLVSPSEAELVVYGFAGADQALDGLVNVLSKVGTGMKRISTVQIWSTS